MAVQSFSEVFIRRPVGTTLLAIGLLLVGVVAYRFLPVASMPTVEFPTISVTASRPGADPETMAATVAAPLERRLGEIPGVTEMTSRSSLGSTRISVQFDLSRNIDGAARDVQAAINAALTDLPGDLQSRPSFRKANPAATPVMILALTSKTVPPSALYDAADTVIAQRLSQVDGVAEVSVNGAEQPAIRVRVNPLALASMGLDMEAVRTAIANTNAAGALGVFDGPERSVTIATNDQLRTAPDYDPIVVRTANGAVVRLSAVASIEPSVRNSRSAGWFNGQPSVLLVITKQADANVIETVDQIYALLPELKRWIPAGIDISVLSDRTGTIRASVADMQLTLLATVCLVMLVVFVFLRRAAATIAAGVTVPLSLAGTCAAMWVAGFSIDNLSLMALAVSVGFVVDDAIVMIENCFRNLEKGMSPLMAAIDGARQIGFTVLSISISLVAAFIPLLFMSGVVGRVFREFSVTLAFAIMVSTVVSLTVTPMICAHFVRKPPSPDATWFDRLVERVLNWMVRAYGRSLAVVLDYRGLTLLVMAGTIVITGDPLCPHAEGLFPAGRHRADLRRHPGLDRGVVPDHVRPAAEGRGDRARRSGGRRRRLLDRHLGLERVGQPRHAVHQPQAARRTRRHHPGGGRPAAAEDRQYPRPDGVLLRHAGRAGRRPAERRDLSVHAVGRQLPRAAGMGAARAGGDSEGARAGRRLDRPRAGRPAGQRRYRPGGGRAARRAHPGHRQHAQQRLCAAADLDALHPAQPVPRDPGGRSAISARPGRSRPPLRQRRQQHAGADHRRHQDHARAVAAGGQSPGPVSGDHHQLRARREHHDRGRRRS